MLPVSVDPLLKIARQAGQAILEVYDTEFSVENKKDDSPLTEADKRSHTIIARALEELYPHIPVISEEAALPPYEARQHWEWLWLVDPLDGTKEFIKKNGEFTVNVALVHRQEPVLGVVYQPVGDHLYWGISGEGAFKSSENGEALPLLGGPHYSDLDRIRVVASRSHQSPEVGTFVASLVEQGKEVDFVSAGSSLKLCLVAEGVADVYPRLGPTMEWDTAAAHAVAAAAGRRVTQWQTDQPLSYNKADLLNPWFVVA